MKKLWYIENSLVALEWVQYVHFKHLQARTIYFPLWGDFPGHLFVKQTLKRFICFNFTCRKIKWTHYRLIKLLSFSHFPFSLNDKSERIWPGEDGVVGAESHQEQDEGEGDDHASPVRVTHKPHLIGQ